MKCEGWLVRDVLKEFISIFIKFILFVAREKNKNEIPYTLDFDRLIMPTEL